MHFDVPKLVRSPVCDQGHDEESRNGRDIKIDILEAYVWTPEVFWGYRVRIGSPEGVPGYPGKLYGPYGTRGEIHQPVRGWCAPIWAGLSGERKRGGGKEIAGIGFPLPFPSPLFPSPLRR